MEQGQSISFSWAFRADPDPNRAEGACGGGHNDSRVKESQLDCSALVDDSMQVDGLVQAVSFMCTTSAICKHGLWPRVTVSLDGERALSLTGVCA
jgi:hypothetical protein